MVGGATVQNPVMWDIGKVTLKFSGIPKVPATDEHLYRYKPRPEIKVRDSFTMTCCKICLKCIARTLKFYLIYTLA